MTIMPGILRTLLLSATLALYAYISVDAAQVPPHLSSASADSYTDLHARADNASKVQFGYFVNW